jgi:hypothetical protein
MASRDEWLTRPLRDRLDRMALIADELAAAIRDRSDADLARRPAPASWAAKEVVCHLRDIEELVIVRFHLMLVMDDPRVFVVGAPPRDPERWGIGGDVPIPLDADRWAVERQYLGNDTGQALAAFARRRSEVLAFLGRLSGDQWKRGSVHPHHGRVTFEDWTAGITAHDDNHLAQLRRALEGGA